MEPLSRENLIVTAAYRELLVGLLAIREASTVLNSLHEKAQEGRQKEIVLLAEKVGSLNADVSAAIQTARKHLDALPQIEAVRAANAHPMVVMREGQIYPEASAA